MMMSAFVPSSSSSFSSNTVLSKSSFCTTRSLSRRPSSKIRTVGSRRVSWTLCTSSDAPTSSDADTPAETDTPINTGEEMTQEDVPEPYPGFFADMKRMGLTEEEAIAQALKSQKQSTGRRVDGKNNMLKPDGTSYAPWMGDMPSFDPKVIKKRTDATGRLAADPQLGELSGTGMTWRMLGDELELSWSTGTEEANLGFVVYRRKGKEENWTKVADYRDAPAELASKGREGGNYSFLVTDAEAGTWVYRVSDVDQNNNVADLSQVLVEIESAEDGKIQKIALAVLLAVLALSALVGLTLDPLSSA